MIPTQQSSQNRHFDRLTTDAAVLLVCSLIFWGCASPRQTRDRPFTQTPQAWNVPVKLFRIVGDNIRQLGFDPRGVKMLVGLHGHYDHLGGAALIKQATGAKLLVGAADRAVVESGGRNDPQYGDTFAWQPVPVDRTLRDGDVIRLGGTELKVHATPGHTPGCVTCTLKVKHGDQDRAVVFAGSISCPDYKLTGNASYPAIAVDFKRTFHTLGSLPCDVFLTEHGWDCALAEKIRRLESGDPSPFIDPGGYRQYLAEAEARFTDLLRRQSGTEEKKPEAITGVLGALPVEVRMLEGQLQGKQTQQWLGVTFHTGTLKGRKVVLAASGVGKVNAAKTATLLIDHFRPHEVLFTGVAGGVNPDLAPGDIVLGEKTAQHDFGEVTETGFRPQPTGEGSSLLMDAPERLLGLAEAAGRDASFEKTPTTQGERLPRVVRGVIVTGDVFVASPAKTVELRRLFGADAVEMEGGAVAQICQQQKVPCLIIRCLSDKADTTANADFERFLNTAATNSARLTLSLLNRLAKATERP
jgi:adenosylhomocysteine nucleosidase